MPQNRVLIISQESSNGFIGGLGRHHGEVMTELRQMGWDAKELILPSPRRNNTGTIGTRWEANANLFKRVLQTSADVILLQGHAMGRIAKYVRKRLKLPVVLVLHCLSKDRPYLSFKIAEQVAMNLKLEGLSVKYANAVCTVSHYMVDRVASLYHKEIDHLVNIGNGVNSDLFNPNVVPTSEIRNEFAFVGRIEPEKGLCELLMELKTVSKTFNDFRLNVYGRTRQEYKEYERILDEQIKLLGFEGRVTFHSFIEEIHELVRVYRQSQAVIVPSLYEPAGLVPLEVAASEGIVVARAAGGIPEFIKHGKSGYLYNDASDLAVILCEIKQGNPNLKLRSSARKLALRWTWADVAAKLERVLMQALRS